MRGRYDIGLVIVLCILRKSCHTDRQLGPVGTSKEVNDMDPDDYNSNMRI